MRSHACAKAGIYEPHDKDDAEARAQREREEAAGVERKDVFGMKVCALRQEYS